MIIDKKKPRSLALTLGGAVVLIAGGAIAYWVLLQREFGGPLPVGANLIPQEALMSVSVTTDAQAWQKLNRLGTPGMQQTLQQGLQNLETRFLADTGFDYEADIRPWVGEQVTMAFLPPSPSAAATANPESVVWVLPVKDLNQARQALTAKASAPAPETNRTYNGVEIQQIQGQKGQKYDLAVLNSNLLVIASNSPALDQVIDAAKGEKSLANTPGFKTAFSAIQTSQPFAQVYVNLPAANASMAARSGKQLPPETLANVQATQGLGSTMNLEAASVSFKTISWLKPDAPRKLKVDNKAKDIAKRLPADTLIMAAGGDFQQFWQEYSQTAGSQLVVPFDPKQFRANVQTSTGMNFDQDFADWMRGQFALALVPAQGKTPNGVGIALLAEANDRSNATKALKQLDHVVRDRLNFQVTETEVGSQMVSTWRVPPGLPVASHGWLDNNVAFLTLGAPITEAILPSPKTNLADSELFQQATRSELGSKSGYFFMDVARTLTLMNNSPLLPKLSPNAREFAQGIRAIGITAAVRNDWSTRYDIRFELQP